MFAFMGSSGVFLPGSTLKVLKLEVVLCCHILSAQTSELLVVEDTNPCLGLICILLLNKLLRPLWFLKTRVC